MIILSPVDDYDDKGLSPVSIKIEENDVRAVLGGTGGIKCGGNYAGSILEQSEAKKEGFDQVLGLDGGSSEIDPRGWNPECFLRF